MKKIFPLILAMAILGCKEQQTEDSDLAPSYEKAVQPPEVAESTNRGKTIYSNYCASCHLTNGKGIPNAFPPLDNSDWLKEKREASISAIKHGLKGKIEVNGETYNSVMVDLGLSNQQVADVMNYINNAWSNNIQPPVRVEEVESVQPIN